MNLNEVINYLQDNGYVTSIESRLVFTNKFNREYIPISSTALQPVSTQVQTQERVLSAEDVYRKFIKDAEVPYRVSTEQGRQYTVSAVSTKAVKVFSRIIEKIMRQELNYEILVFSTKLYYANPRIYRQTLTNYICEGSWEPQYEEFKEKLERGEIESHIGNNLSSRSLMTNL